MLRLDQVVDDVRRGRVAPGVAEPLAAVQTLSSAKSRRGVEEDPVHLDHALRVVYAAVAVVSWCRLHQSRTRLTCKRARHCGPAALRTRHIHRHTHPRRIRASRSVGSVHPGRDCQT